MTSRPLTVVQVLPELNSGGVERGTVDFARFLVATGYRSLVMSAGGRMEAELRAEGSEHIRFPVHRKSVFSLFKVPALRRELQRLNPDLIHVRSRMPAWLVWRALRRWPGTERPVLISTFHGLYSVNFYSAIMGCGDRVIAISQCVQDYISRNYPKIDPNKVRLIHRGVDTRQFHPNIDVSPKWWESLISDIPHIVDKQILLMPGRLSAWKGQRTFISLIDHLLAQGKEVHGLIVGDPTPGKAAYRAELVAEVERRGLSKSITFLGHRSDIAQLYKVSALVFNLSEKPEPFGRTVIEALAVGTPVIAFDSGGPAESLAVCCADGLVPPGDIVTLVARAASLLANPPPVKISREFTADFQAQATLDVYMEALNERKESAD